MRTASLSLAGSLQGPIAPSVVKSTWALFAMLLVCLPLWVGDLHLLERARESVVSRATGTYAELPTGKSNTETQTAPLSCLVHCIQHPLLVQKRPLIGTLVPLVVAFLAATVNLHSRFNSPPLLPPPRAR